MIPAGFFVTPASRRYGRKFTGTDSLPVASRSILTDFGLNKPTVRREAPAGILPAITGLSRLRQARTGYSRLPVLQTEDT